MTRPRLRRLLRAGTVLALLCTALLVVQQPAQAANCMTMSFVNADTDLIVSVELGHTGVHQNELRARATHEGPWEKFEVCTLAPHVITMKSLANGKYVSARENLAPPYTNLLRAEATTVGEWEKFRGEQVDDYFDAYKGAAGGWISSDYTFPGEQNGILANRASIGPWEIYLFHRIS